MSTALILDRSTSELRERGGGIHFPLTVNLSGDMSTKKVCADVGELIAYVLEHHASGYSDDELAEYVRSYVTPLEIAAKRRDYSDGPCFESVYL